MWLVLYWNIANGIEARSVILCGLEDTTPSGP